ncbi:transcription initiation factor tfiid subunit 6 [Anaeramoeba flamelloides]|uniref:Transcription initiation factor tfiid subunit 6 n=1 Tax=Anaeramoeba flamelloides TaxID=1746091 RepID=A0ABQ8XRW5_9EUKA|nr:transcription initiation factor tfiid subunit 6 [Anaeramoeba flamelloides]
MICREKKLPPLPNTISIYLLRDIEFRLRDLILDSLKFMQHSKREKLTVGDINAALKIHNQSPLNGYDKTLKINNTQSQSKGLVQNTTINPNTNPNINPNLNPNQTLQTQTPNEKPKQIFLDDPIIDLDGHLNTLKISVYPIMPTMTAHWIAVDGIDPPKPLNIIVEKEPISQSKSITENIEQDEMNNLQYDMSFGLDPLENTEDLSPTTIETTNSLSPTTNLTNNNLLNTKNENIEKKNVVEEKTKEILKGIYAIPSGNWKKQKVDQIILRVSSEDLEQNNTVSKSTGETINTFLETENNNNMNMNGQNQSNQQQQQQQQQQEQQQNKLPQLVKNVLSRELQNYYEKVISVLMNNKENEKKQKNYIYCLLEEDTGIQKLFPYFLQFIQEKIRENFNNLKTLFSLIKMLEKLIHNESINIEFYIHKIIPIVLTCLLSSEISLTDLKKNLKLRNIASRILTFIFQKINSFPSLQPKITNVLINSLIDEEKDLITLYGAILGLTNLGLNVIKVILVPNVYFTYQRIKSVLQENYEKKNNKKNLEKKIAQNCKEILLQAISSVILDQTSKIHFQANSIKPTNTKPLGETSLPQEREEDKTNYSSNQEIYVDVLELYEMFGDSLDCFIYSEQYHFTQALF